MSQQRLVSPCTAETALDLKIDRTTTGCCRQHLVGDPLTKLLEVDRAWLELKATCFNFSEQQHVFHHAAHALHGFVNGTKMVGAFFFRQPIEITIKNVGARKDDFQRRAKLV